MRRFPLCSGVNPQIMAQEKRTLRAGQAILALVGGEIAPTALTACDARKRSTSHPRASRRRNLYGAT